MDNQTLPVQSPSPIPANVPEPYSKEAISMKKALDWELSLDSRDLRSHAWYHGPIPRQRAEECVQKDGDFLIRDCVSQPGNFVLTCRTGGKGPVLHFVINKITVQRDTVYERSQYQFEDDAYDTIPDLITFYVGSGRPISSASGARIQYPCNRTFPLSLCGSKCGPGGTLGRHSASPLSSPLLANVGFRCVTPGNYTSSRSPLSSPPRIKRDGPKLPSKKQRSQSLTPVQQGAPGRHTPPRFPHHDKYCSADGVIQGHANDSNSCLIRSAPPIASRLALDRSEGKSNSADGVIHGSNKDGSDIMTRSAEDKLINFENGTTTSYQLTHVKRHHKLMGGLGKENTSTQSLPRSIGSTKMSAHMPFSSDTSDNCDCPNPECPEHHRLNKGHEQPPPKPNRSMRADSIKDLPFDNVPLKRVASYHASGSDSGNGSGDSAQSSAAGEANIELNGIIPQFRGGVVIKNPRFLPQSASSSTLKSFQDTDYSLIEDEIIQLNVQVMLQITKFDLENFHTLLLPTTENKPLDNGALNSIRMMLSETGPRVLANHMTRIDIKLLLGDLEHKDGNMDSVCGLELITLIDGEQFRKDLIERTECIRLLVAVTILTCTNDLERAETLNKWIEVAIDTKTALGNLFGFCAIMLGLCMPQIQKLEPTWYTLRQKYTDSAFNFEAKLRPTLKNMHDCSNPQAPNTTVPHVMPYVLLRDRNIDDILGLSITQSNLMTSCVSTWENNSDDYGLETMFAHLDSVRAFTKQLELYRRNARIVLNESNSRYDELLEHIFRTEFHIKFLWGSKGAIASSTDRHTKMEQVLALMADKFCETTPA